MKFLVLFFALGCSANKAKMTGIVLHDQMYFDQMVPVQVTNAPPDSFIWIKLNNKQLTHVKPGDKVVFYVKTKSVEYETR
tara:strand:- start:342 stop:581 length:240 start_codon:yes stop_codon:yes gene_type:complete